MYNAVGQFCALVILFLSTFTHTQNAPVKWRMKKILNKIVLSQHSALTMTFFWWFYWEGISSWTLNKLAQIFEFQSMWNPHHPLQQKSVKF